MPIIEDRSMKEVVARLQEKDSGALAEISELYAAASEILSNANRLAGALREIAGEAAALAGRPTVESVTRIKNLADYARMVSSSAECQAAALRELQRGIEGWDVQFAAS